MAAVDDLGTDLVERRLDFRGAWMWPQIFREIYGRDMKDLGIYSRDEAMDMLYDEVETENALRIAIRTLGGVDG